MQQARIINKECSDFQIAVAPDGDVLIAFQGVLNATELPCLLVEYKEKICLLVKDGNVNLIFKGLDDNDVYSINTAGSLFLSSVSGSEFRFSALRLESGF